MTVTNRILPQNWGEVRDHKGIKIHKRCWGAVAAFFGFGIKWKRVYFVTNSAKNWWKANVRWREEHGFGGEFTKKKFLKLLNTKIQARTTVQEVQKAATVSKPAAYKASVELQASFKIKPPLVISEKEQLQKIWEECEQLLKHHRAVSDDKEFKDDWNSLEDYLNSYRVWDHLASAECKQFFDLKPMIETKIREIRQKETKLIKRKIEHHEYLDKVAHLSRPAFADFDTETRELMQSRWLLNEAEQYKKSFRPLTLKEAIDGAPDYEERALKELRTWILRNPGVTKIDLSTAKTTIKDKILFFLRFRQRFEEYFTDAFETKFDKIVNDLMAIKDDFSFRSDEFNEDQNLLEVLGKIGDCLPKEHENIDTQAYIYRLLDLSFEVLSQGLMERYLEKLPGWRDLPSPEKLQACSDALFSKDSPKAIFEVLHTNFPEKFVTDEDIQHTPETALRQKLEFANIFKQLVEEIIIATREKVRQKALEYKGIIHPPYVFDPVNFLTSFPEAQAHFKRLVGEVEELYENRYFPRDLNLDLLPPANVMYSYAKYEQVYETIKERIETLQQRLQQPLELFISEVDKVLAYAPKQLGHLKDKLLEVQKFANGELSLEDAAKSLDEEGLYKKENLAFAEDAPEAPLTEKYNCIAGIIKFLASLGKKDLRNKWILTPMDACNRELMQMIMQAIQPNDPDKEKLMACVIALQTNEMTRDKIHETLEKQYPGKFAANQNDIDKLGMRMTRRIQTQQWMQTLRTLIIRTIS